MQRCDKLYNCAESIELMEKEIIYLKGELRVLARRKYFRLLKFYRKELGLDDPIYLNRR